MLYVALSVGIGEAQRASGDAVVAVVKLPIELASW
jgi:hypothetical protein